MHRGEGAASDRVQVTTAGSVPVVTTDMARRVQRNQALCGGVVISDAGCAGNEPGGVLEYIV